MSQRGASLAFLVSVTFFAGSKKEETSGPINDLRMAKGKEKDHLAQLPYLLDEDTEASERARDPTLEPTSLSSSFEFSPGFFVLHHAVL